MAFKRGQDPAKSMGLGYGNKLKTKAWKILEFIGSKGEDGASFTEIQKFIWNLNGLPEEDFYKTSEDIAREYAQKSGREYNPSYRFSHDKTRASRGYYATALFGGMHFNGLLNSYCRKNEKKKWVLYRMPEPGGNIYEGGYSKIVPESLNEILNKRKDI